MSYRNGNRSCGNDRRGRNWNNTFPITVYRKRYGTFDNVTAITSDTDIAVVRANGIVSANDVTIVHSRRKDFLPEVL